MKEFIGKLIGRFEEQKTRYREIRKNTYCRRTEMDDCDSCRADHYLDARLEGINKAKEIVNELAKEHKGGWIPCSERLPNHMQTVLFTSEDGYVDCGWYDANENWCVNDNYFPNAFRFIAWQPLPEPYQPKK